MFGMSYMGMFYVLRWCMIVPFHFLPEIGFKDWPSRMEAGIACEGAYGAGRP